MAWQPGNEEWKKSNKDKPFKRALMMELAAAEDDRIDEVPKLSARAIVRAQLRKAAAGDVQAFQAIADRVDGRVPQAIVGDDESPPLLGYREWLAWMIADGVKVGIASRTLPNEQPTSIEHIREVEAKPLIEQVIVSKGDDEQDK